MLPEFSIKNRTFEIAGVEVGFITTGEF